MMKVSNTIFVILMVLFTELSSAQQTVGLFLNSSASYDGYTLFSPINSKNTYLINNCGQKVHSWTSAYKPGQSVYLLENGILLRTGNIGNSVFGTTGGAGGIIEMIDWESKVIWSYTISSATECQHHDIKYLPNGNILALVWDLKTKAEATAAGRTTSGTTLWSEKVIEIKPDLVNGGGSVVWDWKVWDHLVQDQNQAQSNYGSVSASPQLINLNYYSISATNTDWLHCNSVDYNARFDQIVISNHNFSEIWIIDHSTTKAEAAGHTGGNSGKGGDLLYRWGNPQTYNQGTSSDQKLFLQHNANWIKDSFTDGGMIMVFNNHAGNTISYSTVNIIKPPADINGNYAYYGKAFDPSGFQWTYKASTPTTFYASNISGAQRLPNGNTLICVGTSGTFFEVDYAGNMVWKYVNPVNASGIITQGNTALQNITFRAERYAPDFAGFAGKTLASQGYIETGSTFACKLYTGNELLKIRNSIILYPNPAQNQVHISSDFSLKSISVYNLTGAKMLEQFPDQNEFDIDISQFPNGIYIINTLTIDGKSGSNKLAISR
jgi:hypothetical protein